MFAFRFEFLVQLQAYTNLFSPESEEDSPQNTPSLTEMRAPNTSSPVGRGTPLLAQIPVSPISQLSGFSICESDYHDVSDESESDCE